MKNSMGNARRPPSFTANFTLPATFDNELSALVNCLFPFWVSVTSSYATTSYKIAKKHNYKMRLYRKAYERYGC